MQEFSSISVSSYDAESLAVQLTDQSRAGWTVVAIVPTGSTITAYLSRASAGSPTAAAEPAAAIETTHILPSAASATVSVAQPTADVQPVSAHQPAASGAPAGWYADPSSRFELRYWDGGQWTEHVSRAGQQYTDPPVA